ncbi:hypothetical protein [Myxococcus sp. AM010]|uniref:hypothetical protein n=1 Tax=Myxococcus sp. AM010 TaxID=2745138 RepID=UPI0015957FDE|nr:hypothetical protein [Myxococcus sp. AM010]NVJ15521.1 hypothetical protein [Myxococcus sp. AM010]
MGDFYADVLDHVGRPPREFGSVHLHVEPVIRNPLGQATAVVWLQAAFEPPAATPSSVLMMGRQKQGSEHRMLGQFPLPPLEGGRVVRCRLPLELPPDFDEVHFQVASSLHPNAGRVRPAWKRFDTLEIPKESDMKAVSSEVSMGADLGESLLDTVPVMAPQVLKPLRTCYACGFDGPREEYERATMCPRCDAAWM